MTDNDLLADVQTNHRAELAFERRDAGRSVAAALLFGLAVGVLLGVWLVLR